MVRYYYILIVLFVTINIALVFVGGRSSNLEQVGHRRGLKPTNNRTTNIAYEKKNKLSKNTC